jgi:protein TonB
MELKKTQKADLENKKGVFFQVGLCAALLLMIGLFSMNQREIRTGEIDVQQEIIEAEIVEITREEPPTPPENAAPRLQVTSDILNIVRDDKKIEAELTFADVDENIDYTFDASQGGGTYEGPVVDDAPFLIVEDMPKFQGGGNEKFRAWVMKQLDGNYPPLAAENGVQGRVVLEFVIERDGTLANIAVLASPDRILSEAAIKVVSSSPKWTPGKQRGNPVRVKFTLPVDFVLQ